MGKEGPSITNRANPGCGLVGLQLRIAENK